MHALYVLSREARLSAHARFRGCLLVAGVVLAPLSVISLPIGGETVRAEFPESLERVGRVHGYGWSDGYHTCYSSGARPLADLPPRSYPARLGNLDERIAGCPTCRPRMLPGVDAITSPGGPITFYHRFDQYAAQVSQREVYASIGRPVQPIVDPEAGVAHPRSPREYHSPRPDYMNRQTEPTPSSSTKTVDGTPAAPALSEEELEEFRQYQTEKRLRKKFDKYLIDPAEVEPSQRFGGPPVGSEERRRLDEAKLQQLQAELRQRERAAQATERLDLDAKGSTHRPGEDLLPSPSDRKQSLPMDSLLPPFPVDEADLLDQPLDRAPSNLPDVEAIPPGRGERIDPLDSVRLQAPTRTQPLFNAPVRAQKTTTVTSQPHVVREPEARIAEVPNWRFIKQPR